MRRAPVLLTLALLALGGCSAFRASVGVGLGLGASARVGPLDVCGLGGLYTSVGDYYGSVGVVRFGDFGLPGLVRGEFVDTRGDPARVGFSGPLAFAVYPFLSDGARGEYKSTLLARPTEVSASVYALFLAVNVGFDPAGLAYDARRYFGLAAGWDEDEPPAPRKPLSPLPEDELEDTPYRLISAEELALVDSGTAIERARRIRKLEAALRDSSSLVPVLDEEEASGASPVERWVEPRRGLGAFRFEEGTRERLAAVREHDVARAFERAARAREPEPITEALAGAPLAPEAAQADLERRRGELLLERGELDEAVSSFEDEASHRDAGEVAGARARVAAARRLAAARADRAPAENAWSGSADLGGLLVGAQGRSVWAMTVTGDVAWERSDALPEGWSESKVIGAAAGFALMEAQAQGRAWVIAVDDVGEVRWRTPLPTAVACASPMDQVYALGHGRLYVARVDRVLALDAATGRVLWMTIRRDVSFALQESPKRTQPLDWRPEPGPPRRRPDGVATGFRVRLAAQTLEVSTGRGRGAVTFDARSGRRLSAE